MEGYTHDYTRHGTTTLFSALNVATGTVLNIFKEKHRHQEFLAFLRKSKRTCQRVWMFMSSLLNQVERWFGLVTEKIDAFVKAYNMTATPFKWTATAESILAKVERLCLRISGTPH